MTTQSDPIVPIKLIGEECLRRVSQPVSDITDPEFISERERLALALEQFRAAKGFGRAIAAPQIGVNKRFISVNLGHGNRFTVINPRIIWSSSETFTLWDDWCAIASAFDASQPASERAIDRVADTTHACARSRIIQSELPGPDGSRTST